MDDVGTESGQDDGGPTQRFEISEELWAEIEPLLPRKRGTTAKGGRPAKSPRIVIDAIFFVLRTGCQWKALTVAGHGISGSAAHDWFQRWANQGVFLELWQKGLLKYERTTGIEWTWQAMDGAMTKAPLEVRPSARTRQTARNWVRSALSTPTAEEFQWDCASRVPTNTM